MVSNNNTCSVKEESRAGRYDDIIARGSHSHRAVEPFATGIKIESRDQHSNLY